MLLWVRRTSATSRRIFPLSATDWFVSPALCAASHNSGRTFQHHGQHQPEHFHTEHVSVPVGFHISQIRVMEIFTIITRDDAGITHKHPVVLQEHLPIAAKIKRRVSIALNVERLVGILLRLEQCAGGHWVAEFLRKLARNFIPELRVAFLRGNLFREVNNHPAT